MDLLDILKAETVLPQVKASCKRQTFQHVAKALMPDLQKFEGTKDLVADDILRTLLEREKLGSTSIGGGIAIPHGRLEGLETMVASLITLCEPIDFDANDKQGVDIVFVLLAPEKAGAEHLNALAKIARLMRDKKTAQKLRDASRTNDIVEILQRAPLHNQALHESEAAPNEH